MHVIIMCNYVVVVIIAVVDVVVIIFSHKTYGKKVNDAALQNAN